MWLRAMLLCTAKSEVGTKIFVDVKTEAGKSLFCLRPGYVSAIRECFTHPFLLSYWFWAAVCSDIRLPEASRRGSSATEGRGRKKGI